MRKIFCDRCKKEIDERSTTIITMTQFATHGLIDIKFEVCGDCDTKIKDFIRN